MRFDQDRPLNGVEENILGTLLAIDFPGVDELRAQVPHTQVVGKCDCGCPTVDLFVPPDVPPSGVETRARLAPVLGQVTPIGRGTNEIIVFVDDGRLTRLEYASSDEPPPSEWPPLDRLDVVVWEAPTGPPVESVCPTCQTGRLYVPRELVGPMYLMNFMPVGYETACQPWGLSERTFPNCGLRHRTMEDGWVQVVGDS